MTEPSWLASMGVRSRPDEIVVAVEGEDARAWLNGQMTNDLKKLAPGSSVYGLVLTPKGRVLTELLVHEREGGLAFVTPRASWPSLRAQLEKYIIMEDVVLRETDLEVTTVAGARATLPTFDAALSVSTFRADRLGPTVEVLSPASTTASVRERLLEAAVAAGGGPIDEGSWELARIARGIPRFPVDFGERSYPQEAGLKRRALAFDKGCYLGQEVVCMLENRGQVTRSLVRLEVDGPATAGVPILDPSGETVGEVTSAAADGDRTHALGYVKRVLTEPGTSLRVDGRTARVAGHAG
ncbi:MAG: folate-binding protein YgfZ [Sandaracinaceae bacterium]